MRPVRGDVRVIGLVVPSHLVEDIRVAVPHGMTVTIPAEKAAVSKDLWRGVSQKCLFQLPSTGTAASTAMTAAPRGPAVDVSGILQRMHALESENQQLRSWMEQSQGQQQETLNAILSAVQSGSNISYVMQPGAVSGPGSPREELADGDAPAFIPAEIKPKEAETRIGDKSEEAASSVSDASAALRKFRRNGEDQ